MNPDQHRRGPAFFAPLITVSVFLTALASAGTAHAQASVSPENPLSTAYLSGNIERVVYIKDVLTHYNIVPVTRGGIVTFLVPGGILEYAMPKTTNVQIEVSDDALYVTGNGTTGSTPMNLRLADGRITHWMLIATPQGDPQKVIRLVDAPETPQTAPVTASQPGKAPISAVLPSRAPLTVGATAPVVDAPASLSLLRQDDASGVTLSLSNGGSSDLVADPRFLSVTADGQAVAAASFSVPSTALPAGGKIGAQLIGLAPGIKITVTWLIYDAASNTYLRVSRSL